MMANLGPKPHIWASSTLRPVIYGQKVLFKFEAGTLFSRSGGCGPDCTFPARHPETCFGHPRRGEVEEVGSPEVGGVRWRERPERAPAPHSPSVGATAPSARSGAEFAPLQEPASVRGSPPAPNPGPPRAHPRRAPLTPPRPGRPRGAGGALGARRAGPCGAASPGAGGGTEGPEGRERESPTDRLPKSCMQPVGGRAGGGWGRGSGRFSAGPRRRARTARRRRL